MTRGGASLWPGGSSEPSNKKLYYLWIVKIIFYVSMQMLNPFGSSIYFFRFWTLIENSDPPMNMTCFRHKFQKNQLTSFKKNQLFFFHKHHAIIKSASHKMGWRPQIKSLDFYKERWLSPIIDQNLFLPFPWFYKHVGQLKITTQGKMRKNNK